MHFDNNDFCIQGLGIVQFLVAIFGVKVGVANKSNDHARVLQTKGHVIVEMEINAILVIFPKVDGIVLFCKVVEPVYDFFFVIPAYILLINKFKLNMVTYN